MKVVIFCVLILVNFREGVIKVAKASSLISTSLELCGSETDIELTMHGETSSATITLSPLEHNEVCKLKVTAPKTHVVNMQFMESSAEIQRALIYNDSRSHPPCIMSVFLPDNPRSPFWKGDPCSGDSLPEIDLLTPDFKIMWQPPMNPYFTKGRKVILTAVGQGPVCTQPRQHTCMRIGRTPMLCVSDHLLCDGNHNCPKSSAKSDEEDKLCKNNSMSHPSWEQLAVEIFKKFKPPQEALNNNKWLNERIEQKGAADFTAPKRSSLNWQEWQSLKKQETSTTSKPEKLEEKTSKSSDSISSMLSKYGPWGYLMLGMLICGTVLMFCGLWECCFRKPKNQVEPPPTTQPTTVLIINHPDDLPANASPPNYDDLDQPPSYTTLFPNLLNMKQQSTTPSQSYVVEIDANGATSNDSSSNCLNVNIDIVDNDSEVTNENTRQAHEVT